MTSRWPRGTKHRHEEGQAHPKVARKGIGNIPKKQGEALHSSEGTGSVLVPRAEKEHCEML